MYILRSLEQTSTISTQSINLLVFVNVILVRKEMDL
jgi:hypothetical protein